MVGAILQNVKITDTWVNNVEISGLIGTLRVNDVDVSAFARVENDVTSSPSSLEP